MTTPDPAPAMTLTIWQQKLEELIEAATPLGIHLSVFMTRVYRDGTNGTDYRGNHLNADVWEAVSEGALRLAGGDWPDEEAHPEHPQKRGPN